VNRRRTCHPDTDSRSRGGRFAAGRAPLSSPAITTPTSPNDLKVRLAHPDDLPAVVAIYNQTIPGRMATAQLVPVTVQERHGWFAGHTPDRRPMWVAEGADGVLAWVGLTDFHERAAYAATAQISIYLDERARGRGLGGRLLDHAIRESPAAGVTALVGLVFAHNTPSLALFESRGFARWGHMPHVADMDGVPRDLVYVGRHV
jgi:L-amino acid N-acyltransferase YncA